MLQHALPFQVQINAVPFTSSSRILALHCYIRFMKLYTAYSKIDRRLVYNHILVLIKLHGRTYELKAEFQGRLPIHEGFQKMHDSDTWGSASKPQMQRLQRSPKKAETPHHTRHLHSLRLARNAGATMRTQLSSRRHLIPKAWYALTDVYVNLYITYAAGSLTQAQATF